MATFPETQRTLRRRDQLAPVFEATDTSVRTWSPARMIRGVQPRDSEGVAARLGEQFLNLNRHSLSLLGAEARLSHSGRAVEINVQTSSSIGAIPLVSPVTGRPELGLVVRPRFRWGGLGKVLAESGMQTVPKLLSLPPLPYSDRQVPPWVLSTVVLDRLSALLESTSRRFESVEGDLQAPRGNVDWQRWATRNVPSARATAIPCRYPELRVDAEMMGFVHHVLRLQRASLEEQKASAEIASALLGVCELLIHRVEKWSPRAVASHVVSSWMRRPLVSQELRDGLTAGLWTIDQRGLAGTSELAGLPWRLDMELVFENWLSSSMAGWAPRHGFSVRSGRRLQTTTPLFWDPPYSGSQKSLVPDLLLERGDMVLVVDAKYKSHWDEIERAERWTSVDEDLRDAHREDLLQVLAYTTAQTAARVVGVLMYPCRADTWERLLARGQMVNRASVASGSRRVDLILAAVPFTAKRDDMHRLFDRLLVEF